MKKKLFLYSFFIFSLSPFFINAKEDIPFQSTYNPQKSSSVLIQQGRLLTATEEDSFIGDILISNNVIVEVGKNIVQVGKNSRGGQEVSTGGQEYSRRWQEYSRGGQENSRGGQE